MKLQDLINKLQNLDIQGSYPKDEPEGTRYAYLSYDLRKEIERYISIDLYYKWISETMLLNCINKLSSRLRDNERKNTNAK